MAHMREAPLSRRAFLAGGLASWALASRAAAATRFLAAADFPSTPFTLGVASGDPWADSVVLWTRLALDPSHGGGMGTTPIKVGWEVARDDRMTQIVRRGETVAVADWAHSVHVEVDGLEPDRWYWYRFTAGREVSPVGRTRTLPLAAAAVQRFRFGFASCQDFERGYFTALRHCADEDVDVMFHLGDFIYENAAIGGRPRAHRGPELRTLDEYRDRYAQYRADPDLQAAQAAFPWIATWDDHEVANNYAADQSETHAPVARFLEQRAAAYKAYYEHMPLRASAIPDGPFARMYRRFAFGRLASFFVLDTRQYRSDQVCNDGTHEACPDMRRPDLEMLGAAQERWLLSGLQTSPARFNILPQQVMMAKIDYRPGPGEIYSMDQWSGYDVPRTRLLSFLGARQPPNPIVLTGDVHTNWVNDLKVDFTDPRSPVVATELVGTSITSGGDGRETVPTASDLLSDNPCVKFFSDRRGYVRCDVTAAGLRADFRVVEYVTTPGAPISTRASFFVEDGRPGAIRL